MRQLVCVVTDDAVRYLIQEDGSDEVTQIAQVVNSGLTVTQVIELGASLSVTLNSHRRKAKPATTPVAPAPAQQPSPRSVAQKHRKQWGLKGDMVAEVLAKHPEGMFVEEIATALINDASTGARQATAAHLQILLKTGRAIRQPEQGVNQYGQRSPRTRWFAS